MGYLETKIERNYNNFQKPNMANLNWTLQRQLCKPVFCVRVIKILILRSPMLVMEIVLVVTLLQLVCFWLWILFNFWNSIFPVVFKKKHQFCCKIWATSTESDDKMFLEIIPFFLNIYQQSIKIIKIIFTKLQFSLILQGSAC